ncbi:MAG: hypothetical protein QOD92_4185 [Acidimicrobiaceae bacterium]
MVDPTGANARMSVAQQISSWATRCGERIAARSGDESLTYAELVGRGAALASMLSDGDGGPVVVACARRPESLAAIVGVFQAGRVCVPVDSSDPIARTAEVAERVRASHIVWPSGTVSPPDIAGVRAIDMPTHRSPLTVEVAVPDATDVAAVIFTSGSTGRPKGVVYDHALMEVLAASDLTADDHTSEEGVLHANVAPLNYLGGFWCFFGLCHGRRVTMFDASTHGPAALADWIDRERLPQIDLVVSLARAVVTTMPSARRFKTVRAFMCYGEVLSWQDVAMLREHLEPGARIINLLGTTEAPGITIHTIEWDEPIGTGAVPVGRPYEGVDVELEPETGEIIVHSAIGLARGYWDDPDLDSARFSRDDSGTQTYRTGDVGAPLDDGIYVHRGRIDDAVKIRGFLVEPLETQLALRALDGVADAAVLAERAGNGDPRLIAHVAPVAGSVHSATSLRRGLRDVLPAHLVPARFVLHDELPRTARGKVDREALRQSVGVHRKLGAVRLTGLQRAVAKAFSVVLDCDVELDSDFWELGGDSLGAQELVAAVAEATGVELPLDALLEDATVEGVAARLAQSRPKTRGVCVPLNASGSAPPLWCVAGGGGTSLAFRALAAELGSDQPVMVLEANGLQRRGRPDWTIASAARRFIRAMRERQPIGPYRVAGFSYGGLVAYEIGQQLAAAGERVDFVALLDTIAPGMTGRTLARAIGGKVGEQQASAKTRRLRRALEVTTAGLRPRMSAEYFRRFLLIAERASRRYRPAASSFPLVVVQAAFRNAEYWESLGTVVDVAHVPTAHMTLLQPPHVEAVAAVLLRHLATPVSRA